MPDASTVLWALLALFIARVAGQLAVVLFAPGWLPRMDQWQSGLLPYPALLASQLFIVAAMATIAWHFERESGALYTPRPGVGAVLLALGLAYLGGMVFRYAWSMSRHPERRWFGKTIPIVFHCVLAIFLLVVGAHHSLAL